MTRRRRSALAAVLVPVLLLAACSAAAPASHLPAASATPPAAVPPIGAVPPTDVVPPIQGVPPVASMPPGTAPDPGTTDGGGSGTGGGSGSSGGSVPGNPGGGTVTSPPANGGGIVPVPEPAIVTPVTGLAGIHAVSATLLLPAVNGREVAVKIAWWSGVAPCSVLAGVDVARDGSTFTLTVHEGAAGQGVACIEIAMYKATIVDLGKLDPGSYTIKATGDPPAVQVTVT